MVEQSGRSPLGLRQIDLIAIWTAIILLVAVSWGYLVKMAAMMSQPMSTGGMDMTTSGVWQWGDFVHMFLMWTIMMIAMMVPTAVRTLMIFSRVANAKTDKVISPTYLFLLGYLVIWTLFSVGATLLQWQLDRAHLISPMLVSTNIGLGGGLLIAAGVYQLLPIKDTCLRHCQSPVGFISDHFQSGLYGAFSMGFKHGIYCLGCCWVIMLLLFVAGVMNLLWILLITLFVIVEKFLPALLPKLNADQLGFLSKLTGVLLIGVGVGFLMKLFV